MALEYLEVRDPAGNVVNVPVLQRRMTIGRGSDAQVKIDSFTVSRHHTEIFKDPFERWWVRDLKSRNGTRVNGKPITEQHLNYGDVIEIEDFVIRLCEGTSGQKRTAAGLGDTGGITLVEKIDAPIRALTELEPPQVSAQHLSALTGLSATLLATEDPIQRVRTLCQLMVSKEFHGMSAVLLRLQRKADSPPEVIYGPESARNWRRGQLPHVSNTMMRAVRKTLAPVIASNASVSASTAGEGVLAMSISGSEAPALAAIACPLLSDNDTIDVLYVTFPPEYGTNEWLALANLAAELFTQAETSWSARLASEKQALIEKELDRARKIQMRLVPRPLAIPGYEVTFAFEPCRWVGGDYVDVVRCADGTLLIAIADVCGKGLQAALVTACLHTMVRTNANRHEGPVDLATRLNQYLHETLPQGSFVTMMLVHLDPVTGEFEYVNSGHPPTFHLRKDLSIAELESGNNVPLGLMVTPQTSARGVLEPGQMLALYTDGLTELTNDAGTMMGIAALAQHLVEACKTSPDCSVARIGETFTQRLDQFRGNAMPQDDRTFLLIRRLAPENASA